MCQIHKVEGIHTHLLQVAPVNRGIFRASSSSGKEVAASLHL